MKFRIVKSGDSYMPQVCKEDNKGIFILEKWVNIGSPHPSIEDAKRYCQLYKDLIDEEVVEEFEL